MVASARTRYDQGVSKSIVLAFTLALSSVACSSSSTSTPSAPSTPASDDGSTDDAGSSGPTAFTQAEVQALFDQRCSRCHDHSNDLLDLSDPFTKQTVGVATSKDPRIGFCSKSKYVTRVVPGDRDASLLWHKIKGTQDCGNPMPYEKEDTKLTATEIERVGLWIDGLGGTN